MSIGAHQSRTDSSSDEWLTPPGLLARLGPFDLDPCTPSVMPWTTAARRYTVAEDGLVQPWDGRVWLNPPYGPETGKWLRKLAAHGDGIALVFARTETAMFFTHVWGKADALLFLAGRIAFLRPDGTAAGHNAGGPSVLIAYGQVNALALANSGLDGALVILDPAKRDAMPLFAYREASRPTPTGDSTRSPR